MSPTPQHGAHAGNPVFELTKAWPGLAPGGEALGPPASFQGSALTLDALLGPRVLSEASGPVKRGTALSRSWRLELAWALANGSLQKKRKHFPDKKTPFHRRFSPRNREGNSRCGSARAGVAWARRRGHSHGFGNWAGSRVASYVGGWQRFQGRRRAGHHRHACPRSREGSARSGALAVPGPKLPAGLAGPSIAASHGTQCSESRPVSLLGAAPLATGHTSPTGSLLPAAMCKRPAFLGRAVCGG